MSDESATDERWEVGANTLHLTNTDGSFQVWLNTEAGDYDGLIVGLGSTRQEALLDAGLTLNMLLAEILGAVQ